MRSLALRSQLEVIKERLAGDATLRGLVGNMPDGTTLKAFLDAAPQGALEPFIYYVVPTSSELMVQSDPFQRDSVFNFIVVSTNEHRFDIEARLMELFTLFSAVKSDMVHRFSVSGSLPMSIVDEGTRLFQIVVTVTCNSSLSR